MIRNTNQFFSFTTSRARNSTYGQPWRFLNEYDIKRHLSLQNSIDNQAVLVNVLREKSFKTSQIIVRFYLQLSELIMSCFTDLNILFVVPFLVEPMFPEWTQIRVHLVIFMAIRILEDMWAQFAFFCFKAQWVLRSKNVDLVFFFIFFLILFYFQFIFQFSIFRTLGLGLEVIGHNIEHRT